LAARKIYGEGKILRHKVLRPHAAVTTAVRSLGQGRFIIPYRFPL